MIVDWSNLKKRLQTLFLNEEIRKSIEKKGKRPSEILNYKFGDHIYNLFLSFFGINQIEDILNKNVRILIYGAWELDNKWLKKIVSFLEKNKKEEHFEKKLIAYLWKKGLLYGKGLKSLVSEFLGTAVEDPDLWEQRLIYYLEKYKPFVAIRRGVLSLENLKDHLKGHLESNVPERILVQKRVDMLMGIDITLYSLKLNPIELLLVCNDQDILPALEVAKKNGAIISSCFFEEERANETILCYSDKVRVLKLTELEGGMGKMKIMNGKIGTW
jgi:uncharacterized LabA/DUF88 family protein